MNKTLETIVRLSDVLGVDPLLPAEELSHRLRAAWCAALEKDPEFVWVLMSIFA